MLNIKDIMNHQPIVNIGLIGHVANGKSSIVYALTNKRTQTASTEIKTNKTINLGYANAKIWKCNNCEYPENYFSTDSKPNSQFCRKCNTNCELVNHVSFIDSPGHNALMATMLNGTSIMDCTILVESFGNIVVPSAQTIEHLKATKLTNTPNKIICLNKIDLVSKLEVNEKLNAFEEYIKNTVASNSIIVPVIATHGINIDLLCYELSKIKAPERNFEKCNTKMIITRSFNNNKPGTLIADLTGGVVGGSLVSGFVKVGDFVELLPGITELNKNYDNSDNSSKFTYRPLKAKILSIESDKNNLEIAVPGGLISAQLDIDPYLTEKNKAEGSLMVPQEFSSNYDVYEEILIKYSEFDQDHTPKKSEIYIINVNSKNCKGKITELLNNNMFVIKLQFPIAANKKDIVTIMSEQNNDEGLKVIGSGTIRKGKKSILV